MSDINDLLPNLKSPNSIEDSDTSKALSSLSTSMALLLEEAEESVNEIDSEQGGDLPSLKLPFDKAKAPAGGDLPSLKLPLDDDELPVGDLPSLKLSLDDDEAPAGGDLPSLKLPFDKAKAPAGGDLPSLKLPFDKVKAPAGGDLPSLKLSSKEAEAPVKDDLFNPFAKKSDGLPSLKKPAIVKPAGVRADELPAQADSGKTDDYDPLNVLSPTVDMPAVKSLDNGAVSDGLPSVKASLCEADFPSLKPISDGDDRAEGFPSLKQTGGDGLPSLKPMAEADDRAEGFPTLKQTGGDAQPSAKPTNEFQVRKPFLVNAPARDNNQTFNPVFDLEQPVLKPSRDMDIQRRNTLSISSLDFDRRPSSDVLKPVPKLNDVPGPSHDVPELAERSAFGRRSQTMGFVPGLSAMPMSDDPLDLMNEFGREPQSSTPSKPVSRDILGLFDVAPEPSATTVPEAVQAPSSDAVVSVQKSTPMKPAQAVDIQNSNDAPKAVAVPTLAVSNPHVSPTIHVPEIRDPAEGDGQRGSAGGVPAEPEVSQDELFDLHTIQSESNVVRTAADSHSAAPHKKSILKRVLLIAVTGLLILAGIGVAVAKYIHDSRNIPEDQLPVLAVEEDVNVNWTLASYDTLRSYQLFYNQAIKRLKQEDVTEAERNELQGKVLVVVSLAQTRYAKYFADDIEMLDNSASTIAEKCENNWCKVGLWSWGLSQNKPELVEKFHDDLPQDEEFKPLIRLIESATSFASWNPDGQTDTELQLSGDKILEITPQDDALVESWPLYGWVRAMTLKRLGKFDEALKVFPLITAESEDALNKPALVMVQSELQLIQDQYDVVRKQTESLLKSQMLSPEERNMAERLNLIALSATEDWESFEKKLETFIHNKDIENAPLIGAEVCIHMNRMNDCVPELTVELSMASGNLAVRKQLIELILKQETYETLLSPEKTMNKLTQEVVGKLIDDGIQSNPDDMDLWKYKGLFEYSRNQYEVANKAFDDVEHGEHLIWSGAFLRLIENWRLMDKETKNDKCETLKNYAASLTSVEDGIMLCQILSYVGEVSAAHDVIDNIYKRHPDDTLAVNARFDMALLEKDREMAEKLIRQLEARKALQSIHRYKYAKLIHQLGDSNAALEIMLKIISTENNVPEYLSYTGQLFFASKHYAGALDNFNHALEIDSSNDEAHFYKGRCLYELEKYEDALIEFNEASSQNDTNRQYSLWIGLSLAKLRQPVEALRSFSAVIDSWSALPKDERTPKATEDVAEAYFYRAELQKYQNQRKDAASDYLEALKLSHNNIRFTSGYAVYLYENNQFKESVQLIDNIEKEIGSERKLDAILYFVRGLSYLKLEKRPLAVSNLEKARDLGFADLEHVNIVGLHDPAEIYERLGYLYRDLGKREAAKESLKLYLEKSRLLSPATRREVELELEKI